MMLMSTTHHNLKKHFTNKKELNKTIKILENASLEIDKIQDKFNSSFANICSIADGDLEAVRNKIAEIRVPA